MNETPGNKKKAAMGRGEGRENCKCKGPEAAGEVWVFMEKKKSYCHYSRVALWEKRWCHEGSCRTLGVLSLDYIPAVEKGH